MPLRRTMSEVELGEEFVKINMILESWDRQGTRLSFLAVRVDLDVKTCLLPFSA